ncbi:MAG: hypothetical protein GXO76_07150 [Calditrichaeota bacterium]|nr:hypothetical protein [Calditrichota bacterium]
MKRKNIIFFIIFFVLPEWAFAGNGAADFLSIGISPRASGLGGAFAGVSADGTAFLWNPAGIAGAPKQIHAMAATQFGGFQNPLGRLDHLGITLPIYKGDLAFNYVRFSVDDIPIYPELKGENITQRLRDPALRPDGTPDGYLNDAEEAFIFTFVKENTKTLDLGWLYSKFRIDVPVGLNLKILHTKIGRYSASGVSLDVGFQVRLALDDFFESKKLGRLIFGLSWQNLTQSSLSWSTHHHDVMKRALGWGLSYLHPLPRYHSRLLFVIGKSFSDHPGFGVEWNFRNRMELRIGSHERQVAFGAGFSFWKFHVNYALETHELNASHRLGLSYYF